MPKRMPNINVQYENSLALKIVNVAHCNSLSSVNTLKPGQVGRHFPDAIFKNIFLNESD